MSRCSIGENGTILVLLKRGGALFPSKFAVAAFDSCDRRLRSEIILECPRHCWRFPIITRRKHTSKPAANSHERYPGQNVDRTISEFPCGARCSFNQYWFQQKGLKPQVKKNHWEIFSMFVPTSCSGVIEALSGSDNEFGVTTGVHVKSDFNINLRLCLSWFNS
jgi:hypothetical protein